MKLVITIESDTLRPIEALHLAAQENLVDVADEEDFLTMENLYNSEGRIVGRLTVEDMSE